MSCAVICSDVTMSLFEIRYDYDTIMTKNRDYRYDFDFSSNATTISTGPLCNSIVGAGGGGAATGREDWSGRRWSDAIISASRSALVLSAGVACGAFIQALHFVGEGERVGRCIITQRVEPEVCGSSDFRSAHICIRKCWRATFPRTVRDHK